MTTSGQLHGRLWAASRGRRHRLAAATFILPPDTESWSPSYRSCISYFVRRQAQGAFQTVTKHFSQQATWDVQVNLSLLLGLNVDLPRAWQQLREREKQLAALRGAASDGAFGDIVGDAAELASELAVAEDELSALLDSVNSFTIIPSYRTVETEVTSLGQQLTALNNQIVSDRDYLAQLDRSLAEVRTTPSTGLAELFAAAEVQLPDVALAAYDEVQAFHDSVIANRRSYLSGVPRISRVLSR